MSTETMRRQWRAFREARLSLAKLLHADRDSVNQAIENAYRMKGGHPSAELKRAYKAYRDGQRAHQAQATG